MAEMICYDDFRYNQWRGRVEGQGIVFFSPNKKFILRGIGEMAEGQMDIFVACFALSNGDVLLLRASGALC